jgi:hypothetical protein
VKWSCVAGTLPLTRLPTPLRDGRCVAFAGDALELLDALGLHRAGYDGAAKRKKGSKVHARGPVVTL